MDMRHAIGRLLTAQVLIATALFAGMYFSPWQAWAGATLAGGLISLTTALFAHLLFRRMPKALDARTFYGAMLIYEALKWMIVAILVAVCMQVFALNAVGIVVGFAPTYLGSHFYLLRTK